MVEQPDRVQKFLARSTPPHKTISEGGVTGSLRLFAASFLSDFITKWFLLFIILRHATVGIAVTSLVARTHLEENGHSSSHMNKHSIYIYVIAALLLGF